MNYFKVIDYKQNKKGLDNQICTMYHAMNTNHEWSKLRLDLDCNSHAIALKYTNFINTSKPSISWKYYHNPKYLH
jgi:hypothetical protein